MSTFKILHSSLEADRRKWIELWSEWPDREVSAHPAYGELFTRTGDQLVCVSWHSKEGGILFPLILRQIGDEVWAPEGINLLDATTPYGYGGPFKWNVDTGAEASYWQQLHSWALQSNIVSIIARLSLFPDQLLQFDGKVEAVLSNVVRKLNLSEEELWLEYAHKVRKNVKRARKCGLTLEVDASGDRIEEFFKIYTTTMVRRKAQQGYLFNRIFFESIINELKGQFVFFHALHKSEIVSTELVLVSSNNVYSFLGGTLSSAFDVRPNDFLKHEIILWAMSQHKHSYVLGGGYGEDDGIYRYKLSFAPLGSTLFEIGKLVVDPVEYERILMARIGWEENASNNWIPRPDYFPSYRAPGASVGNQENDSK